MQYEYEGICYRIDVLIMMCESVCVLISYVTGFVVFQTVIWACTLDGDPDCGFSSIHRRSSGCLNDPPARA